MSLRSPSAPSPPPSDIDSEEHNLGRSRRATDEEQYLINESSADRPSKRPNLLQAAGVLLACASYLSIGPSLILVNRTILKGRKFDYPMTVSGLGLLFSSIASSLLVLCGCAQLTQKSIVTRDFYVRNLIPIGAALATTLATGNAVYLYLPVGYIQMLKAFTPVVTLSMLWLTGVETPTTSVLLAVLAICAGTAIASVGEGQLNALGLLLMLTAEVAEAVRLVLTQKLLNNLRFGVIEGQFYMAPVSAMWLFTAAAYAEWPRMRLPGAWSHVTSLVQSEPQLFVTSAVLGFAVHLCTFLVIKCTNSVTLKVLGTARNAGLVLFSSFWYHEHISELEALGYAVSLLAFGAYNYLKIRGL